MLNIYCDESCHLLNDHIPIMTLGAIYYPSDNIKILSKKIAELKTQFNCKGELKWTKVSAKNIDFYFALIDLFITEKDLCFRSVIVHNKQSLNHEVFNNRSHDDFYYKMYYTLLSNIIENKNNAAVNIYIDIKDTISYKKIKKLNNVLQNKFCSNEIKKIEKIQEIRSHESNVLQLCDFLLGAVTYYNRSDCKSNSKYQIACRLSDLTGFDLVKTTPPWEDKFNLFHFTPRKVSKC